MSFDKILIVLSNNSALNKDMLDSMKIFFKVNKSNLNWCYFIDIPLKFPIDTEDNHFKKIFDKSEYIRKEFYDKMNLYKIPKNRLLGNVYKVRNITSGLVEVSKNYKPDLVIIPEILMDLKPNMSMLKYDSYMNLKKIFASLNSSLMIWERDNS